MARWSRNWFCPADAHTVAAALLMPKGTNTQQYIDGKIWHIMPGSNVLIYTLMEFDSFHTLEFDFKRGLFCTWTLGHYDYDAYHFPVKISRL